MAPPDRRMALSQLLAMEPLKTWSVIVTLLGDRPGAAVTGGQIRALLDPLGLKPEATRVALHRLRADGWITSAKAGREAVYTLSPHGLAETEAVRADVYGERIKYPEGWCFVLVRNPVASPHALPIRSDVFAMPRQQAHAIHEAVVLDLGQRDVPGWVQDSLVPAPLRRTAAGVTRVLASQSSATALSNEAGASLRLLILHHWRRMALRPGTWADIGLFPDGDLAHCRRLVLSFLKTEGATCS